MFKRFFSAPISGAVGSVVSALLAGLSWAGVGIPDDTESRLKWFGVWFIVSFISATWAFIALYREKHALEKQLEPKATLRYDPTDTIVYVRFGSLQGGEEYRHRIGIVNLSKRSLTGMRVVLDNCAPDEAHAVRIGEPLGDRFGNDQGLFNVNAGDGIVPTAYVDVFQEFIPKSIGATQLRFLYSNSGYQPNFFKFLNDRTVTLRLEGRDLASSVWIKFEIRYNHDIHHPHRYVIRESDVKP